MADRLDIYNEEVLKEIEREYKNRIDRAYRKSIKETKNLVNMIQEYREHSYEEICKKIERIGKNTFLSIDDDTAYRRSLFENFESQYEKSIEFSRLSEEDKFDKINNEIENILKYSSEEDIKKAAVVYRTKKYDEYIENEKKQAYIYHGLFNLLEAEEAKDYMALYQDFKYNEELLESRICAVKAVCNRHGVGLPLCLEEEMSIKALNKEVRHAVKVEELNDEEKSFVSRAIGKAKYGITVLNENSNIAAKISGVGFSMGVLSYLGTFFATRDAGLSSLAFAFTTPIVIAASTYGYKKLGVKDDEDSVNEAKQIGVFDRKVRAIQKEKAFIEFDKNLKDKYTKIQVEGEKKNGLY